MRRQQTTFVVHIFNIKPFFCCGFLLWLLLGIFVYTLHNMQQNSWYILNEEWFRCLLFSRYNRKLFCVSTNFSCARYEYKIPILTCCCFNSSVCFLCFLAEHLKRWPLFFLPTTRAFIASMHVLCSSIRPTRYMCVCVCFIALSSSSSQWLLLLLVLMLIRKFYCSNSMFCAEFRDYALFLLLFKPFICQNKYVR